MKKVAIVIPIHSSGKLHFEELLDTFTEENSKYCDLYFVFDNKDELRIMSESGLPRKKLWNEIIVEDCERCSGILSNLHRKGKSAVVTFKKFYGLEQVLKLANYDYFMCIDVDSRFLDLKDAYKICDNFHNKKKLYGAKTGVKLSLQVNEESIRTLEKSGIKIDEKKIQRDIQVWFSQIPIYEAETLREFLCDIGFSSYKKFSERIQNPTFSYIVYAYYCVNSKGYEMVDLRTLGIFEDYDPNFHPGSLEHEFDLDLHNKLRELEIDRNWQFGNCPRLEEHIIHYHVNRHCSRAIVVYHDEKRMQLDVH